MYKLLSASLHVAFFPKNSYIVHITSFFFIPRLSACFNHYLSSYTLSLANPLKNRCRKSSTDFTFFFLGKRKKKKKNDRNKVPMYMRMQRGKRDVEKRLSRTYRYKYVYVFVCMFLCAYHVICRRTILT